MAVDTDTPCPLHPTYPAGVCPHGHAPAVRNLRAVRPAMPRPGWCPVCRGQRWWVVHIPAQCLAAWQCGDCHHIVGVDSLPKR